MVKPDIGQAFLKAIKAAYKDNYQAFNIIGKEKPTVKEVINFIYEKFGYPKPHFSVPFAGLMEFLDIIFPWEPLVTRSMIHLLEECEASNDKGNITYHFKNKKNILEAIIEKRIEHINQLFNKWNQTNTDPLIRLMYFCDMLVFEQENLQHYCCPMGTLTGKFAKNEPELYQITLPMFKVLEIGLNNSSYY